MPLESWILHKTKQRYIEAQEKFIPVPQIRITEKGLQDYTFEDFDPDLSEFKHEPVTSEILLQNLTDLRDRVRIKGYDIDFDGYNPQKVILEILCSKPEIDYAKSSKLIQRLIVMVCSHYMSKYGPDGMRNIIMMYKFEIAQKIYEQMMKHFINIDGFLQYEVIGVKGHNIKQKYNYKREIDLYENFSGNIREVLFTGIKKGVFSSAKFDSVEGELTFARLVESDPDVLNWLRPAPEEFNITYSGGRRYEPDFVIETENAIYMTEVKGENMLQNPDVTAKKETGIKYCEASSSWGLANGYKPWRYLFIPTGQINMNSSFLHLAQKFKA